MHEKKFLRRIFVGLCLLLLFSAVIPCVGTAAPAEKPITGEEWMAKSGMDWGPNYWPTKPVRGGILQGAGPLFIGLMNPNHWPVNDWVTISYFYDKLI